MCRGRKSVQSVKSVRNKKHPPWESSHRSQIMSFMQFIFQEYMCRERKSVICVYIPMRVGLNYVTYSTENILQIKEINILNNIQTKRPFSQWKPLSAEHRKTFTFSANSFWCPPDHPLHIRLKSGHPFRLLLWLLLARIHLSTLITAFRPGYRISVALLIKGWLYDLFLPVESL